MAGIKHKDTKAEVQLRKALFALGYRYRKNSTELPGKPDLVFRKYRAVVFIHGCFWHMHECYRFKWPKDRHEFWRQKLETNAKRDSRQKSDLIKAGWRIATVWECALFGRKRLAMDLVTDKIVKFLHSTESDLSIFGE